VYCKKKSSHKWNQPQRGSFEILLRGGVPGADGTGMQVRGRVALAIAAASI
jgi:hypothetical protein